MNKIDNGNEFDFGKTSFEYPKYRDIYPASMYQKLYDIGIGHKDQKSPNLGHFDTFLAKNDIRYRCNDN